jgi:hypothetical protein
MESTIVRRSVEQPKLAAKGSKAGAIGHRGTSRVAVPISPSGKVNPIVPLAPYPLERRDLAECGHPVPLADGPLDSQ